MNSELLPARRLSKLWSSSITASVICTAVCAMANIHYLTNRESYYFLQNMCVPSLFSFCGAGKAAFSLPLVAVRAVAFSRGRLRSREI